MCLEKQCNVINLGSYQLPFSHMILLFHEFILDHLFVHSHSWTQTLWIKQWYLANMMLLLLLPQEVSDLLLAWICSCHDIFSTFFICTSRQTTNVSEMTRTLFGLFTSKIWISWVVLHCWIRSLLQKIYIVHVVCTLM